MSTTAVEVRGPNKALFRTGALAGSAILWGSLGYLALTYVPNYEKPIVDVETSIIGIRTPIIVPPPPLPLPEPVVPDRPILRTPDPVANSSPLTTRQTPNTRPNPLAGELPAGPPSTAPTIFQSGPEIGVPAPWVEPVILATPPVLPEVIESPPVPLIALVINPVRLSGDNPTFPNRALDRGMSGAATLSFTVMANGKVDNINVIGESPSGYGFARAARDAIQNWTFRPQTIDGVAVAYPARYTISFKLED